MHRRIVGGGVHDAPNLSGQDTSGLSWTPAPTGGRGRAIPMKGTGALPYRGCGRQGAVPTGDADGRVPSLRGDADGRVHSDPVAAHSVRHGATHPAPMECSIVPYFVSYLVP